MYYNYFTGHIYVEKTFEQCYLGYRNSQRARKGVWWDKYLNKGSDDQKVEGEDDLEEELYGGRLFMESESKREREKTI